MPVVDGLTVCRVLRGEGNRVPILMLTARAATGDRIAGLDAGADDYLPKPFDLGELLARIRALLRRTHDDRRRRRDLQNCASTICASTSPPAGSGAADVELDLTKTEFDLLELLVRNAGIVLDHSTIYERIWNYDFGPDSKNLAVYIGYLRRKTEAGGQEPADPHRSRRRLRGPHRTASGPNGSAGAAARPRTMSLRWKIAIAVGAMAALATLAVGLLSYRLARDRMYAEIDVSLTEAVAIVRGDDPAPRLGRARSGPGLLPDPGARTRRIGAAAPRPRRGSPTTPPARSSAAAPVRRRHGDDRVDPLPRAHDRVCPTVPCRSPARSPRSTACCGSFRTRIIVLVVARHRGGHAARLADRRRVSPPRCAA